MWKKWLIFSKNERYGLVTLFILLCFTAFFPFIYQVFFFESSSSLHSTEIEKVDSFFRSLKYQPPVSRDSFSFSREETPPDIKFEPFAFDPNTISIENLLLLGFSNKQARVIDKYRKKGGFFKNPTDFSKMYVVDSIMFTKLRPFIRIETIPEVDTEKETNYPSSSDKTSIVIELNSADTIELVMLKGIGKGYARRIVAYRQLLGGYRRIEQLSEVWGFSPELIESIRQNITIDSTLVKTINVNMVSYQDLKKHPYLTDYQAKAIIYYRETKGDIESVKEILDNKLIDQETYRKIQGYLLVN